MRLMPYYAETGRSHPYSQDFMDNSTILDLDFVWPSKFRHVMILQLSKKMSAKKGEVSICVG
jgi:hypothetical protein